MPWKIGNATAKLGGSGRCTVGFTIQNTTEEALKVCPLPLVTSAWRPVEAQPEVELKAGRRAPIAIDYQQTGVGSPMPTDEAVLRLPVLIVGSGMARIETLRADIAPVTMLWNVGARFNQSGTAEIEGRIANTTKEPVQGSWDASFLGQQQSGTFNLKAGEQAPVKLNLKLPDTRIVAARQKGALKFNIATGGITVPFNREIEIVRNMGLKQSAPLIAAADYVLEGPVSPSQPSGISFRADADDKAFYLTWDITGINLQDNPNDNEAFNAEVSIDARTYGKRLGPGVIDALRVSGAAADGDAQVTGQRPWNFGTGYSTKYDNSTTQAKFSSKSDGTRRLTLMVPRELFYLHEWALKNGNSELGIQTTFRYWKPGDASAPAGSFAEHVLVANGLHRDDAESLAVLELTEQPTNRWTVRIY